MWSPYFCMKKILNTPETLIEFLEKEKIFNCATENLFLFYLYTGGITSLRGVKYESVWDFLFEKNFNRFLDQEF